MNARRYPTCAHLGAIVAASLWTTGCAYGIKVHSNEASGAADSRYVTYFVLQGSSSGSTTADRQMKADIEVELTDKGLVEVAPEEADAVVIVHTATPAKHSRDAFYQGWGGWDLRLADTRAPNGTENYSVGTVVVDMFDAWTKKLLWHGAASKGARIFRSFPFGGYRTGSPALRRAESAMASDQGMRIIFSPVPALLIRINGEPKYEQVTSTELQRVVNTTALIVRDVAGMHYLRRGDTWMEADDLTASWSTAGTVPEGAEVALTQALSDKHADLFASRQTQGPMPVVCVSTTPAELIVTDGEPQYARFKGTPLLYIRNTTGTVFREPTDQELYVRVPTGWLRAWTANGPWQPVPEDKLPADLMAARFTAHGYRSDHVEFSP
jgi:hypothetical protein